MYKTQYTSEEVQQCPQVLSAVTMIRLLNNNCYGEFQFQIRSTSVAVLLLHVELVCSLGRLRVLALCFIGRYGAAARSTPQSSSLFWEKRRIQHEVASVSCTECGAPCDHCNAVPKRALFSPLVLMLPKIARNSSNAGHFKNRMYASAPCHLLWQEHLCSIGRLPSIVLRQNHGGRDV